MADSEFLPLSPTGATGREWFIGLVGLGGVLGLLDAIGVIDRSHGLWFVLSGALLVVWLAAGVVWAVAEYRRRHPAD